MADFLDPDLLDDEDVVIIPPTSALVNGKADAQVRGSAIDSYHTGNSCITTSPTEAPCGSNRGGCAT